MTEIIEDSQLLKINFIEILNIIAWFNWKPRGSVDSFYTDGELCAKFSGERG